MDIFPDTQIDWLKYRWRFLALSFFVFMLCGFDVFSHGGLRYGIDFSEGTIVYAKFREAPKLDDIRKALSRDGMTDAVLQSNDRPELNQVMIGVGAQSSAEGELDANAARILRVLREELSGQELVDASTEVVGPVVGGELRQKAMTATLVSMLAMLIYIGFRFEFIYGVGATVALVHDVLVTLGIFSVFGYELSLNVIAAFLTLVGYSVNDTIVIFDRVRENRQGMRKSSLYEIINTSINQTLRRTILTSALTFLSVLALFLFGGEALEPFAFVMLVGIITGTYSTLGIASPIVMWWKQARGRRVKTVVRTTPSHTLDGMSRTRS